MELFNKIKSKISSVKKKYNDFKTIGAGKTMFYGRYRRVEFAKKVLVIFTAVLLLVLAIAFLSKKVIGRVNTNVEFAYLKQYFKGNGYSCQTIEKDGGNCFKESETGSVYFTRYDEGFYYLIKTDNYELYFRHIVNTYNDITFSTTDTALAGYKSKTYSCYTDDGITGKLEECITKNGIKLDSETYIGVVNEYINKLNEIIDASGYRRDSLLDDYYWIKK